MYLSACCPTASPTQNAYFKKQRISFWSKYKHLGKSLLHHFLLKPRLSLWMSASLFSSPVQVRAHTQHLALSHRRWSLKAFILSFFVLQWVFIFGGFHWQKKKCNSWARVFTESYIPECRGSLHLPRSDFCCYYARTYSFINCFQNPDNTEGTNTRVIMPSNSQYLQSFFVWDLKALDSIKSSFPWLSQRHLWTWRYEAPK